MNIFCSWSMVPENYSGPGVVITTYPVVVGSNIMEHKTHVCMFIKGFPKYNLNKGKYYLFLLNNIINL